MKKVIDLAVINEHKEILLVKKNNSWILPGGKILSEEETDYECLIRELTEEIPKGVFEIGRYYDSFYGVSPNKMDEIQVKVYFGKLISGEINPFSEIKEAMFTKKFKKNDLSEVTYKIIKQLKKCNYL